MKRIAIYFTTGEYGEMLLPIRWDTHKMRKFIEITSHTPVHAIVLLEGAA